MEITNDVHKKVIDVLGINPRKRSPKGWIMGGKCPFCEKDDKFGIILNDVTKTRHDNHISFNCFRGSCQEKGGEFLLLQALGQEHFLQQKKHIKLRDKVENKLKPSAEDEYVVETEVLTRKPAFGWRRKYDDPYLRARGWEDWQFELMPVGRTTLFSKLKDYVVIQVEEGGENKGYVARLTWDKERVQEAGKYAPPRYRNEGAVDFAKIVGGLDEITEETRTVIIVEGLFDKTNVDKQLQLNLTSKTKCIYTFGKKVSEAQIEKLKSKASVKNVIFLYDPDAVNEVKRYGSLLKSFANVYAGFLTDKDPGDLTADELEDVIESMEQIDVFACNKVQKKTF